MRRIMRTLILSLSILATASVFAQDGKHPVPVPLERKEREKEIKDLYKSEYAKKSSADRKAFARKLLKQGLEEVDVPTLYVLFEEARKVASSAGDVETDHRDDRTTEDKLAR